jgi:hypothetical protein
MRFTAGIAAALLTACSPMPDSVDTTNYVPLSLAPASLAGVVDRRADFRAVYCTEAHQDDAHCVQTLRRFRDEGQPQNVPVIDPSRRGKYRVAVALGVGWDCLRELIDEPTLPVALLQSAGFNTKLIEVEGLSGSDRNAEIVVTALQDDLANPLPLILIGYSKGANDIMVALEKHPDLADRTAAFISVAGAIGGSPVAENDSGYTEKLLHFSPFGDCGSGDNLAMDSLSPSTRHAWLQDHLPLPVPAYSMITAPEPARVSRALRSPSKVLGVVHPLNDGALLHWDQLIPGSTLLGYANADHWAVSVPLDTSGVPFAGLFVTNDYDRVGLWQSMLDFVIADLEAEQ